MPVGAQQISNTIPKKIKSKRKQNSGQPFRTLQQNSIDPNGLRNSLSLLASRPCAAYSPSLTAGRILAIHFTKCKRPERESPSNTQCHFYLSTSQALSQQLDCFIFCDQITLRCAVVARLLRSLALDFL
jgi:hypothetical protein